MTISGDVAEPSSAPLRPLLRRRGLPSGAGPSILLLLAGHAVLAQLMAYSPTIATIHALTTLAVAGWIALFGRRAEQLLAVTAYVAGCEVLWRQTSASMPWEVSLYLVALLFAAGLVRFSLRPPRRVRAAVPIVYLALLVPGAFATIGAVGVLGSRPLLGFYLGGPVALGLGVLWLRQFWLRWEALRPVLWALILPIFGTLVLATVHAIGLSAADFLSDESNIAASGGFGPNQVSAVVGLGALTAAFLALVERNVLLRVTASVLVVWCLAQGALTFSRGGLANVLVAAALAAPHFLTRTRHVFGIVIVGILLFVVGGLFLLPRLEDFTGGRLEQRLTSADGNRVELAQFDLELFADEPLTGVGVGLSEEHRGQGAGLYAAHTEYSRLLAEHGLFGLAALLCLIWMAFQSYKRASGVLSHAWVAALIGWSATEMTHSAMRLSVTPFIFALAALLVIDAGRAPPDDEASPPRWRRLAADR